MNYWGTSSAYRDMELIKNSIREISNTQKDLLESTDKIASILDEINKSILKRPTNITS